MLFGKERFAQTEIYNDIDGNLVNLFRCVKFHCPELQRELSLTLNSREEFYNYVSQLHSRGLTDIQRATRFFVLIKTSYGSDRRSFGCTRKNILNMTSYLEKVHSRLNEVIIENKSYENVIKAYDGTSSFFYLDPPYYGAEMYYDNAFQNTDHQCLNDLLKRLKGRFLLSYNDDPYIRELYKNFHMVEISRQNNFAVKYRSENKRYKELLIMNY